VLLQANYDRALDAPTPWRNKELWAVVVHPLATLATDDLPSLFDQVVMLVRTRAPRSRPPSWCFRSFPTTSCWSPEETTTRAEDDERDERDGEDEGESGNEDDEDSAAPICEPMNPAKATFPPSPSTSAWTATRCVPAAVVRGATARAGRDRARAGRVQRPVRRARPGAGQGASPACA
jgi:hypothetical protein